MIKAVEAAAKVEAYETKIVADKRARATEWIESKISPIIQSRAEQGGHFIIVRAPVTVEWAYAREYLEENGYDIENHCYGDYRIEW